MDKTVEDFFRGTGEDCDVELDSAPPEWKVFFHGGFWGHRGRDRAGKEIRFNRQFDWAGRHWVVPAAYACGRGLVQAVDFLSRFS